MTFHLPDRLRASYQQGAQRHIGRAQFTRRPADIPKGRFILRKAFPAFPINAGLTSKFQLYRFSPKSGLMPMKLKPKQKLKQAV